MQRAFYGQPKSEERLEDLSARELCMMMSLVLMLVWLGLYPQTVMNTSAAAMAQVRHYYAQAFEPASALPTAMNGSLR
jgi:NADH-quinone oxidoreductase subunit M